jgi:hypothetical protein
VDHNGNTYEYYLARVGANVTTKPKAKYVVEIICQSVDLPDAKMSICIYGGFTFLQLSVANYNAANLTDKLHFHITKTLKGRNSKVL